MTTFLPNRFVTVGSRKRFFDVNVYFEMLNNHFSLLTFFFPSNLQAAIYKTGSKCVAFLANLDSTSDANVTFNGNSYNLPAWSVSILPDCKNVVYNTAKVGCHHDF